VCERDYLGHPVAADAPGRVRRQLDLRLNQKNKSNKDRGDVCERTDAEKVETKEELGERKLCL